MATSSVLQEALSNPVLKRIAACESTGNPNAVPRQFNRDGAPLGETIRTGKPIVRDGRHAPDQYMGAQSRQDEARCDPLGHR